MNVAPDLGLKGSNSTFISDLSKAFFFVLQFICPFYELRCKLMGWSYSYLINAISMQLLEILIGL